MELSRNTSTQPSIPALEVVEIEIDSNCNMSCSYCPNSVGSRREKGRMSFELYDRILGQLREIGFSGKLAFHFYNEPLLVENLEQYVARARSVLPKCLIHVYSNGTKLSRSRFEALIEAGVDLFIVTKHEKVSNLLFERTLEELDPATRAKYVRYRKFTELKLTNRGGILSGAAEVPDVSSLPCSLTRHMMTITVEGNVVPCSEDFNQNHEMGNLGKRSLRDIWNSREYALMRKTLLLGKRDAYLTCSKCNRTEAIFDSNFLDAREGRA